MRHRVFLCLVLFNFAVNFQRCKHHQQNCRNQHWEAIQMIAPHLLKEIEGIALLRLHQKHIVCVGDQIEDIDKSSHTQKQEQRTPKVLDARLDLACDHKHEGIKRQQDMYGKGMPMHKIGKGQFRPGWEKQGEDRRGDADAIKEIIKGLKGLENVDGDHENIDTAKMKRQIIFSVVSEGDQNYDLQDLVKQDKRRYGEAEASATPLAAPSIQKRHRQHDRDKGNQPADVKWAEVGKAVSLFD